MSRFDSSQILCIYCATLFEPLSRDLVVCPNCHSTIPFEQYDRLIRYANAAVRFGYVYRRVYENQYQQDEQDSHVHIHIRYSLPIDEILAFAALAVLSGIIGNLSYDIVKAVLKKIQEHFSDQATGSGDLKRLINNSSEFNVFITYLTEYRDGLPHLNPMVKQAIFDELSVDVRMATESKIRKTIKETTTDETPRAEFVEQVQKLQRTFPQEEQKEMEAGTIPPDKNDFEGFWQLFE